MFGASGDTKHALAFVSASICPAQTKPFDPDMHYTGLRPNWTQTGVAFLFVSRDLQLQVWSLRAQT
jgi:hypothetical protein